MPLLSAGSSLEAQPTKAPLLCIALDLHMTAPGPAQLAFHHPFAQAPSHLAALATPCAPTLECLQLSLEDFGAASMPAANSCSVSLHEPCVLGEGIYHLEHLERVGCGSDGDEDE